VVHRVLERFDLTAEPTAELRRQRRLIAHYARRAAAPGEEEAVAARARELLRRFAGGDLFPHFLALAPRVVARELPVLLPPAADGGEATEEGAVGFVSGTLDLVYRDGDALVIADYKTDAVDGGELAAHARRYAAQGRAYAAALTQAFALRRPPRFELWYLNAGRVVLPSAAGR
ncbi:MAG: hypothetical protein D6696_00170, partial [Acidobacteria bacterium]